VLAMAGFSGRRAMAPGPAPVGAPTRQIVHKQPVRVVDELTKIALKCTKTSDFELQK